MDVCSSPSIRSYCAMTFVAAQSFRTATITSAFLDNVHIERDGDSGATPIFNDKVGYRSGPMSSFHTIIGSTCSILMVVYVSGGPEVTLLCLLAFNIGIGPYTYSNGLDSYG
ncbi:hypothetical protein TNCV_587611 [Trichonephila clavipes]|nr:hypothetical protein TNCV_587611 [Trichonephila clavipes]